MNSKPNEDHLEPSNDDGKVDRSQYQEDPVKQDESHPDPELTKDDPSGPPEMNKNPFNAEEPVEQDSEHPDPLKWKGRQPPDNPNSVSTDGTVDGGPIPNRQSQQSETHDGKVGEKPKP